MTTTTGSGHDNDVVSPFDLPPEIADLVARTRAFIRDVVIPAEPAPGERLPDDLRRELQAKAKAAGVFAPHAPVEFGGLGLPLQYWAPVFQEAGYSMHGPKVLNCMAPDEGNMHLMHLVATPEQQERFLRPLVEGDAPSCFAMTEPHPGVGSDPAMLKTTATRVDGGWLINGEKRFTSGAIDAAFSIVMASTEDDNGDVGATMFLVDTTDPGFIVGRDIHAIERAIGGGHPYVTLKDIRVSDDAVLGEVGKGYTYAQVRLGPARLTHCMRWLGLARRAHDTALDRANTRELFGARMSDLGLAQELIATSVIDIETTDALITKTGWLLVTDPKAGSALSSVAKVYASEAVFRIIDRAMQLLGGDGVSDVLPVAAFINEVRPFRIYDGSTETHKWAISRRATSSRRKAVEAGEKFLATPYDWED